VLDRRLTKKGNAVVTQVLVKWNSLPKELARWEDYSVIKARYPSAATWGQAGTQGGSSVMADTQ
jgi:hypothetical protein